MRDRCLFFSLALHELEADFLTVVRRIFLVDVFDKGIQIGKRFFSFFSHFNNTYLLAEQAGILYHRCTYNASEGGCLWIKS